MKALLPVYCRPLGYVVLLVALFIPFILVMQGVVTDTNLLFYKECTKLLMMAGCLLIIFALSKNETFCDSICQKDIVIATNIIVNKVNEKIFSRVGADVAMHLLNFCTE